jgi:hypothetical protein
LQITPAEVNNYGGKLTDYWYSAEGVASNTVMTVL